MRLASLSTKTGVPACPVRSVGDREAVPARHDRRVGDPPGLELDRPGHADADAADVARVAPDSLQQLPERGVRCRARAGAVADLGSSWSSARPCPPSVDERQPRVGGAEVGGEDELVGVDRSSIPAGRPRLPPLSLGPQVPAAWSCVDALRERRPGQAGEFSSSRRVPAWPERIICRIWQPIPDTASRQCRRIPVAETSGPTPSRRRGQAFDEQPFGREERRSRSAG